MLPDGLQPLPKLFYYVLIPTAHSNNNIIFSLPPPPGPMHELYPSSISIKENQRMGGHRCCNQRKTMKHNTNILRTMSAWTFAPLCSTGNQPFCFTQLLCPPLSFKLVTSYSIHYDLQRWRTARWFCTLGFSLKIQSRNCKQITKDSGFCCSRRTVRTQAFMCLYQELHCLSVVKTALVI